MALESHLPWNQGVGTTGGMDDSVHPPPARLSPLLCQEPRHPLTIITCPVYRRPLKTHCVPDSPTPASLLEQPVL